MEGASTVEGYLAVRWRVRSTVEGYHQYGGGLSEVQWGAIMQYSGGWKYGGGLSLSTVEDAKYGWRL